MKNKMLASKIGKRIYIALSVVQLISLVLALARGNRLRVLGNLFGVASSTVFLVDYIQTESKGLRRSGEQSSS